MPNDDEDLIRDRIRGAAEPADPSGAYERILERRVRRRIWNRARVVTVAVAVVVATVGGTVALASVFRGTPGTPGSGPTPIGSTLGSTGEPSASPSESPSPISVAPSASPSESPSASPVPCDETTTVQGDFDGDGVTDSVTVIPPSCPYEGQTSGPDWGIDVRFGSGAAGAWALFECGPDCAPAGVADIDGDGIDELALVVDGGASTKLMNVLEIPPTEVGPAVLTVGPDGTEGFPPGEPALFPIGGSVKHLDFVTCRTDGGVHQVLATHATLSQDETTWSLTEVVFEVAIDEEALRSGEPVTIQALTVVGVNTSTQPFDPNAPPSVEGVPCFPNG